MEMRTEQEMTNLILGIAKADERIRAVYMNGSRTNPNVLKDDYRDYDVVFTVTQTESFIKDRDFPLLFGELLIVQEPDSNDLGWGTDNDSTRRYAWLMLFKDGIRIDLSVEIKEETDKNFTQDTLTVLLLDKDGILPEIPPPNDAGYWIKPPVKEKYYGCCNEFWWCLNNVAKGIAREQLPYAMRMYMEVVHTELEKMTDWYIGINCNFSVSSGMWGKYFKKYLPLGLYEMYEKTYSDGEYNHFWEAIFTACNLFHILATEVAAHFCFQYREDDEDGMREYLRMIKCNEDKSRI